MIAGCPSWDSNQCLLNTSLEWQYTEEFTSVHKLVISYIIHNIKNQNTPKNYKFIHCFLRMLRLERRRKLKRVDRKYLNIQQWIKYGIKSYNKTGHCLYSPHGDITLSRWVNLTTRMLVVRNMNKVILEEQGIDLLLLVSHALSARRT
jgi:hypothetical protein